MVSIKNTSVKFSGQYILSRPKIAIQLLLLALHRIEREEAAWKNWLHRRSRNEKIARGAMHRLKCQLTVKPGQYLNHFEFLIIINGISLSCKCWYDLFFTAPNFPRKKNTVKKKKKTVKDWCFHHCRYFLINDFWLQLFTANGMKLYRLGCPAIKQYLSFDRGHPLLNGKKS